MKITRNVSCDTKHEGIPRCEACYEWLKVFDGPCAYHRLDIRLDHRPLVMVWAFEAHFGAARHRYDQTVDEALWESDEMLAAYVAFTAEGMVERSANRVTVR